MTLKILIFLALLAGTIPTGAKNFTRLNGQSYPGYFTGFENDVRVKQPVNLKQAAGFCFTAWATVQSQNANSTDVIVSTSGGSGSYWYYFAAEINKFRPGGPNCRIGPFGTPVPFSYVSPNRIRFGCVSCNIIVYIQVIDNVTGCIQNLTATVSLCIPTAEPDELSPVDPVNNPEYPLDNEQQVKAKHANEAAESASLKMTGPGQLLVDKGNNAGTMQLKIVDFQGRLVIGKDLVGSGTHRINVSALLPGKIYIAFLQRNGRVMKREKILIQ